MSGRERVGDNTFEVPYSPERLFTKDPAQVKVQIDLAALETGAYHRCFRSFSGHEEAWEAEDGFTSVETARREEETRYHVGSCVPSLNTRTITYTKITETINSREIKYML